MAKIVKNNSGIRGVKFFIFLIVASWTFFGWPGIKQVQAAITYQTPGAIAYSASGGTSVAPAYPASIAANDLLVLIIGMKPSAANSGSVTTPSGWTSITSITGAGGYGTTLGADTGNTNLFTFYKVAAGTESGSLTVTIATNNVSWAQMYRFSNATGLWSVAGATGSDITGTTSVSIAFSSDPGVTAADYIIGAMCIPTDVTTPSQFSVQALSQSGITFGTVTEISEPDSGTGNDIGGFTYRSPISSGTSSGVPTLTATAGGTVTNVRGPGVFIRVRELPITLSISVSPLTWGVGTVDEGTIQVSTSGNKIGVTNDGNVSETFTLQIATQDNWGEWTAASLKNGAGNNIYVLSGIFCATADSPVQASFNETDSEDVLTTAQQTATSTKFAYAGGSANAVAVPVSGQRSLWLRLDMPTAVSGTYAYDQHTVTVRISCQQS